jgi:hypothetical protein
MEKNAKETAEYIQSHLKDLAQIARTSGLNALAFFIEMAAWKARKEIGNSKL